jgi:glycosyltransferase involved in cell wall biosynthesis
MNVLFLSVMDMVSIDESNIYTDLIREFVNRGHHVDIVSPIEKRSNTSDTDIHGEGYDIYKPHIGNITNTGFAEKGVSILKYRNQIIECIKDKIRNKTIDLFLVAVPPVTVDKVVAYVKKQYGCKVYLLLKDIWPASMFDLKTTGGPIVKKAVCTVFRVWEKHLYNLSDSIGCLSQGNVEYILKNNRYLAQKKVHVNPNSIIPHDIKPLSAEEQKSTREKYGVPVDKIAFIYGGTLGVGQNVAHIVECLKACQDLNCHFVISGRGVQYNLLEQYRNEYKPDNLTLINGLPKAEYDKLMQSCDVGMVFLRYTAQTPNIPSRILTYMDYSLPILSCTDPTSDLNQIIEAGRFGWGCLSNDPDKFRECVETVLDSDIEPYKRASNLFLREHYGASESYSIILRELHLGEE